MAEAVHRAACSCGQLTAECRGAPVRISVCHCLDCQRRTGGPFAAQARFAQDQVTISCESRSWTRISDSGNKADFHFCPTCGGGVFYRAPADADTIAVPIGGFADPSFPAPWVQVYQNRQHPWLHLDIPDEVME